MDDCNYIEPPAVLPQIEEDTRRLEFDMGSDYQTGALLRNPGGHQAGRTRPGVGNRDGGWRRLGFSTEWIKTPG